MSAATTVQEPGATSSRSGGGRKISSASTATTRPTKEPSRTRDRDRERDRDKDKDRDREREREGREKEKPGERERKAERQFSGASATGMVEELQRIPLHDAEPAPPTLMYWSRAPVWGVQPTHKMRSHSATVVDNTMIWMFGGCDDKESWRDVMCLDVGEHEHAVVSFFSTLLSSLNGTL